MHHNPHDVLSIAAIFGIVLFVLGVIAVIAFTAARRKLKLGERLALATFNVLGLVGGGLLIWHHQDQLQLEPLVGAVLLLVGIVAWLVMTIRNIPTPDSLKDLAKLSERELAEREKQQHKTAMSYTRTTFWLSLIAVASLIAGTYFLCTTTATLQ